MADSANKNKELLIKAYRNRLKAEMIENIVMSGNRYGKKIANWPADKTEMLCDMLVTRLTQLLPMPLLGIAYDFNGNPNGIDNLLTGKDILCNYLLLYSSKIGNKPVSFIVDHFTSTWRNMLPILEESTQSEDTATGRSSLVVRERPVYLHELDLSSRAQNVLEHAFYSQANDRSRSFTEIEISELVAIPVSKWKQFRGMGGKTFSEVKSKIEAAGYDLIP